MRRHDCSPIFRCQELTEGVGADEGTGALDWEHLDRMSRKCGFADGNGAQGEEEVTHEDGNRSGMVSGVE